MTVLSDKDILNYMEREEDPLVITPFYEVLLTPNGVDLLISNKGEILTPILLKHDESVNLLDLTFKSELMKIEQGKTFTLNRGERLRVDTLQEVKIPKDLTGHLYPRTKYEHRSLVGIKASGPVDAGYEGTLSITFIHDQDFPNRIELYPFTRVAQLQFEILSSRCELDYYERSGSYGRKGENIVHTVQLDPEKERELIREGNLEGLLEYYNRLRLK